MRKKYLLLDSEDRQPKHIMHIGELLGLMVEQWKLCYDDGLSSVCLPIANNHMSLMAAVLPSDRNDHLIE
jgi:hypothetical protein